MRWQAHTRQKEKANSMRATGGSVRGAVPTTGARTGQTATGTCSSSLRETSATPNQLVFTGPGSGNIARVAFEPSICTRFDSSNSQVPPGRLGMSIFRKLYVY